MNSRAFPVAWLVVGACLASHAFGRPLLEYRRGREDVRRARWNLWVGGALGGVAGAIVGYRIDIARFEMLRVSAHGGFAVRSWIYGGLRGGVVTGVALFILARRMR